MKNLKLFGDDILKNGGGGARGKGNAEGSSCFSYGSITG
jgi:hypothetical protein